MNQRVSRDPALSQSDKFKAAARELECDDDEARFDERVKKLVKAAKVCPECGHRFQGNGWDGVDAHWRSKHEDVMPYAEAWPLLNSGNYSSRQKPVEEPE